MHPIFSELAALQHEKASLRHKIARGGNKGRILARIAAVEARLAILINQVEAAMRPTFRKSYQYEQWETQLISRRIRYV